MRARTSLQLRCLGESALEPADENRIGPGELAYCDRAGSHGHAGVNHVGIADDVDEVQQTAALVNREQMRAVRRDRQTLYKQDGRVVDDIHDRVLVEETSLARRPGLPITDLRARLADRLARAGITGPGDERLTDGRLAETVCIPLDLSTPPRGRVIPFGAAASLVHPATGYGLGDMLRAAPLVAATIADALPRGPNRAAAAAHRQLWSPRARAVQWLRRRGLTVLLGLPPGHMARFFDLFFDLPGPLQHAYLNERENLAGTATAMARLFKIAPWPLRVTLAVAMSEHNPTV